MIVGARKSTDPVEGIVLVLSLITQFTEQDFYMCKTMPRENTSAAVWKIKSRHYEEKPFRRNIDDPNMTNVSPHFKKKR